MKHAGKARREGTRLLSASVVVLLAILGAGVLASWNFLAFKIAAWGSAGVWFLFSLFCLNFFRDPDPNVPNERNIFVAPAHGKVDVIEEATETEFMGGRCRRVSTFLSVIDIHVQNSPVSGTIAFFKYRKGKFFNAMNAELSPQNENVLIGFDSPDFPGEKIAVRLIAGMIARRIVPWIALGDSVARGERTSLIRFGSRVDLYLPLSARVEVRLGDRVRGGETVIATRD